MEGSLGTRLCKSEIFVIFSNFWYPKPSGVRQLLCQLVFQVFHIRDQVLFNVWWIGLILKHYNTISLSRHEQVCLSRLRFERYGRWWEKYLSKRSLLKHTYSWRDKLIVLWILNRQAKTLYFDQNVLTRVVFTLEKSML